MKTIDLFELRVTEYKDIYAWLLIQEETVFHISMKKFFVLPEHEKGLIAAEYYDALYLGEKLSEFSDDFGYYTPSEYSRSAFGYDIITGDMEKLADTLFYLIRGVIGNAPKDYKDTYWDDKDAFWWKYNNDEIEPVCKGLLHILEKNNRDDAFQYCD